jgi:hypothetical protein
MQLRVLREEDVRALNERALTAEDEARRDQLDELGRALARPAGVTVAEGLASGEGSHTLSWIWYTAGKKVDAADPKFHEGMRNNCIAWSPLTIHFSGMCSFACGVVEGVRTVPAI